jgi:sugar/nucleoside kinase (ribokinase family)
VCTGGFAQRVGAADRYLELTGGDYAEQLADHRRRQLAAGEKVQEPEADHGLRAAQQGPGRDLALFARGDSEDDHATERRQDAELGIEGIAAAHMKDRVDTLAPVGLADRGAKIVGTRVDRGVGAEPLDQRPLLLARGKADHLRAGTLAELHSDRASAAGGGLDHERLARLDPSAAPDQRHRGQALQEQSSGLVVIDLVGHGNQQRLGDGDLLRVAATAQQRSNPPPIGSAPADLRPGNQRQGLLGQVVVPSRVRVGEVDPTARDVDDDHPLAGLRLVDIDVPQNLGATKLLDLNRLHRRRSFAGQRLSCRAVSLTVVGSIAFDSVRTPFGERDRMLGGAAVHFSLAASFFTEVRPVGPVGEDFGPAEFEVLERRGVLTDDIERVAGGESFFWRGRYDFDLNVAHTEDTRLGVFGEFEPKLSAASQDADMLFLANIQPELQRQVRAQCGSARFSALDSMNLWIETAKDSLLAAIAEVDCVILNDAEIRQLTGEGNLARAARALMAHGPRAVVAKQGEYGAALFTEDSFFALPGFPLEDVRDPTGAGDSFAGGFIGYLDGHDGEIDEACLRRAMGYGTVLASFNVEQFGTERVAALTREEIDERFAALHAMTSFEPLPAPAE